MKPRTHFGALELPRDSSHDIDSISSTYSNTNAAQTASIGCVGVSSNQHHSRIRIILQDDLHTEKKRRISHILGFFFYSRISSTSEYALEKYLLRIYYKTFPDIFTGF